MNIKLLCLTAALFLSVAAVADDSAVAKCRNLVISEAGFKVPFTKLEAFVIENGGVRIVESDGSKYLFAIGMTDLRADSPKEQLRRMTVARAKAVRELIRMIEKAKIEVKEESKEEVVEKDESNIDPTFFLETVKEREDEVDGNADEIQILKSLAADIAAAKTLDELKLIYETIRGRYGNIEHPEDFAAYLLNDLFH